jgi:hypothetical protein
MELLATSLFTPQLVTQPWGTNTMNLHVSGCCVAAVFFVAGCSATPNPSSPAVADWPVSARAAAYSPNAKPGFDTPEGVTRLLEQRWSLAAIRAFCIPERRFNTAYQNLVVDTPQAWKGRLYSHQSTGFDRISWYATVDQGRVQAYSLEAYRGKDFWSVEIGNQDTVHTPPQITPDISRPDFVGHK